MADKKISALTGATTPLAGTEVLPIVQSGATVKVSVDNLTAGKTVAVDKLAVNGVGTPYGEIDLLNPSAGMNRAMMFTVPVAAGANNGMQIGLRREGNSEVISSMKMAFNDLSGGLGNYISINTGITDQETLKCDSAQNVTVTSGNLIMGTAGKGTVFGNGTGVSFKGTLSGASVSTTPVTCSESATSGGGVVYVSGYNASGGNRFVALIGFRDTIVTPIYLDNNTGLVLSFTAASNVLRLATVSGTVICSSVSLTV